MGKRTKSILDVLWLGSASMSGAVFVGYYFSWHRHPSWQELAIQWLCALGTLMFFYIGPRWIYRNVKEARKWNKQSKVLGGKG